MVLSLIPPAGNIRSRPSFEKRLREGLVIRVKVETTWFPTGVLVHWFMTDALEHLSFC